MNRPGASLARGDADRLAELEEERRFLLRSLRDLDAEYGAGDVETEDYVTLRDGYTKRAADVLRDIESGRAALAVRAPRNWGRLGLGVTVVIAVAIGAGMLVARSSGQRLAGQQITGLDPRDEVAALLAEARALTTTDQLGALERYDQVLSVRPEHPEALTYSGWIGYLTSIQIPDEAVREALVEDATGQLARAVAADGAYADPHCFLGIIAVNARGDEVTGRQEMQTCLDLGAPASARGLVEQFLAALDEPAVTTVPG